MTVPTRRVDLSTLAQTTASVPGSAAEQAGIRHGKEVRMAIRRRIMELFEAIPARIEVSGGSFEAAVAFARDAFGDTAVIDRRDRRRWWPRVTLTITTDPEVAATAPPLDALLNPEPDQAQPSQPLTQVEAAEAPEAEAAAEAEPPSFLEEIFTRQEQELQALREARRERRHPRARRTIA
jgi:hypothetical protein